MAATYTTLNKLTGTADWSGGWLHGRTGKPLGTLSSMQADGDTVTVTKTAWDGPSKYVAVKAGETWAFSAEVRGNDCGGIFAFVTLNSATENGHARADCTKVSATDANPPTGEWQVVSCIWKMTSDGYIRPRAECNANTGTMQVRHYMLTKGTTLPAYAPAGGETLACAAPAATPTNLLAGLYAGDSISSEDTKENDERFWRQNVTMDVVGQNACAHVGYGLSVASAATDTTGVNMSVRLVDLAGHANYVNVDAVPANRLTKDVRRVCTDFVIPAGQRMAQVVMCKGAATTQEVSVWHPSLSIGGAVTLASSAHTPYATQDHVMVTYATKASLKVTDDSIKAEVTERGKLAGRVGTLESTSSTHTSKLEQLATSIKSLVKGESTYTDPDGKSTTSGIYSLVTQTRDSVTALFGQYTKTDDLGSTAAVKDAKKAGTDAQAAASAAQSTADSAKSTAQAAASDAATAKTNASSAVSTANTASSNASKAVSTANAASSSASSAVSTANEAKTSAASAVSTANSASTSAANAVETANAAASDAATAKTDATSAANTASNASKTAQDAKKTADGISVGGRNIARGSATLTNDVPAGERPQGFGTCDYLGGIKSMGVSDAWEGIYFRLKDMADAGRIKAGQQYTASVYVMSETDLTTTFSYWRFTSSSNKPTIDELTGSNDVVVDLKAGEWHQLKRTFTATSGDDSTLTSNRARIENNSNVEVWYAGPKLESGNRATDYSPAPEDVDAAIGTAQDTANAASSTAGAAKSTADSLATMIREDATGITVGKSADGQTWSTGRTHMTADSFDVLDKAGNVLSSFGEKVIELGKNSTNATISMLAGLMKIQARKDGSNTFASVSSDLLSLDSLRQAIMRAGKETSGAYVEGVADIIATVTGMRGVVGLYCTQGDGFAATANNAFTVSPDGYDLGKPEYLAAALLGTGSGGGTGITHSQEGVTFTPDLDACGPGVFSYGTSTANRPTSYGTCVCIRAGDGTTSTWLFEFALPTEGDPLWRRNINGAGWTSWWTITSQ